MLLYLARPLLHKGELRGKELRQFNKLSCWSSYFTFLHSSFYDRELILYFLPNFKFIRRLMSQQKKSFKHSNMIISMTS